MADYEQRFVRVGQGLINHRRHRGRANRIKKHPFGSCTRTARRVRFPKRWLIDFLSGELILREWIGNAFQFDIKCSQVDFELSSDRQVTFIFRDPD